MTHNPNWPLIEEAVAFFDGPNTAAPLYWSSLTSRTIGSNSTRRGRQYELDQVQTGQYAVQMINTDGALDPDNTSSIYTGLIKPYRQYRKRAMSPVGPNLLPAIPPMVVLPGSTLNAEALPYQGFIFGNGFDVDEQYYTGTGTVGIGGVAAVPGQQYTFSLVVIGGAAPSNNISLGFQWINAAGTTTAVSSTPVQPTTFGYPMSYTATAPAGTVGMLATVTHQTVATSLHIVAYGSLQVELGGSATAYTASTWKPVFYGYVERWPQSWTRGGNYGVTSLTVVDAFGFLSQRMLTSAAYGEFMAAGATSLYALDEPTGNLTFADATGLNNPISPYLQLGATSAQVISGTSTGTPNGPLGITQNCLGLNPTTAGVGVTGLNMLSGLPFGQPSPLYTGGWSRVWAVNIPTYAIGTTMNFWTAASSAGVITSLSQSPPGYTGLTVLTVNGVVASPFALMTNLTAGWHLLMVSASGDGKTWQLGADGVLPKAGAYVAASDQRFTVAVDAIQSPGLVSCIGDFPTVLTPAQFALLWATFVGNGGQSSGVRYQDILRWAGWAGASAVDTYTGGQTQNYGAAVELRSAVGSNGTDALSALQTVVDTENGSHYADASGLLTFKARRGRYAAPTRPVVATFGENVSAGEIPYEEVAFDYDPTRLTNDVTLTQATSQYAVREVDLTSSNLYGSILLQRTVNTLDTNEMSDAAQYLVARFKAPTQRIQLLRVSASHQTRSNAPSVAGWTALLSLEIGVLVNVNRRAPGRAAMSYQGIVEQINWTMNDQGDAYVELQVSSALGLNFWTVGATRLTLASSAAFGATTLVVNALPDAAVNRFEANIHPTPSPTGNAGWMLYNAGVGVVAGAWITAIAPTVVGYTTATLTIFPALPVALAAGSILLETTGNAVGSAPWLQMQGAPVNQFDAYSTLGSSTVLGY